MQYTHSRLFAFLWVLAWAGPASAQAPTPVMEYSSILDSLDANHQDGRLLLEDDNAALATVFLPEGVPVEVAITEVGSDEPLVVQSFARGSAQGVFSRLGVRGNIQQFHFSKPGDYLATY